VAAGAAVKGVGGKKGRSGRKSKAEEMGLVALLNKCWTRKDREDCITKLAEAAKDPLSSDRMDACKLLMSYSFGKPTEKVEATITHREFEIEIGGDATQSDSEPQFIN